jgi:hypothetical protein
VVVGVGVEELAAGVANRSVAGVAVTGGSSA